MTNWVIIPCHVGLEMTRAAVESALKQDIPTKLFIVNNGATDVQNYLFGLSHRQATVVSYNPQKGVSYAWNRALEYSFGEGAEAVFVINNDIVLRPDSYRLLLEDGGEFVTCVGSSDPHCVDPVAVNVIGADGRSALRNVYATPNPEAKRPNPDYSCWLMRRSVWGKVGPFDEAMVHYCSDCDHHIRMHRAGINAYCLDLPFYHRASGTMKELAAPEQAVILNQAQRDRNTFERKYGFRAGSDSYYEVFGGSRPEDPGAARD